MGPGLLLSLYDSSSHASSHRALSAPYSQITRGFMAVTEAVEVLLHGTKSSDLLVSSPLPPSASRDRLLYSIITQFRAEHIN